jgi:hypothetical protein
MEDRAGRAAHGEAVVRAAHGAVVVAAATLIRTIRAAAGVPAAEAGVPAVEVGDRAAVQAAVIITPPQSIRPPRLR